MPTGGRSTLVQFPIEERRRHPDATGDLNGLVADVALACKAISRRVAFGSLADALGGHDAGGTAVNVQGERQKTLDVLSKRIFLRANEWGGHVAAMLSEELEHIHLRAVEYPRGKYLLAFDPLGGSSNIDVNVAVGSLFSIARAVTPEQDAAMEKRLPTSCSRARGRCAPVTRSTVRRRCWCWRSVAARMPSRSIRCSVSGYSVNPI